MVLAPEHPLVDEITTEEHADVVSAYRQQAQKKSELERTELQKEKTGVPTGGYAINPVNGKEIPIWVADYVLASYGTGAIMAVPGQDERDWAFAEKYDLPIVRTVQPPEDFDGDAYTGDGPAINSGFLNGLDVESAKDRITNWLEEHGYGAATINYKLRDWLFSRQRYWGEPFPIIHVDGEAKPVPANDLPVELPAIDSYNEILEQDAALSPLGALDDWVETTDPETGQPARRETNTMPQWAGSCWYFLRFIDPHNDDQLVDPEKEAYWMPVDLYVGGAEHAVLHLLYARFWHKVLYDAGVVSTQEPFQTLVHQGLILGETEYTAYVDADGAYVSAEHVEDNTDTRTGTDVSPQPVEQEDIQKDGDHFVLTAQPEIRVDARSHKMSKSRGNVVNPDDVIDEYGADALRLYEMFMGPLEQVKPWSTSDVDGVYRFLGRVWRLIIDSDGEAQVTGSDPSREQLRVLHETIQKVTEDIESLGFNTAIAKMMEFVNAANKWDAVPQSIAEPFVKLLSPFAPHIAEELWARLDHDESIAHADWPEFVEEHLKREVVEVAVQVNGTVRGTIKVAPDAPEEEALSTARADDNVARYLDDGTVRREIYVPGRIVNFVVN
jgi:leucyl-tRNA synthetase